MRPGSCWRVDLAAWVVAVAVGIATAASAQDQEGGATIQVRSGNHPQFARLVFVYQDRRAWALVPTESGYDLRIDRVAGYGLSNVFDLIPRDRIADIRAQDDGSVAIDVVCDCHADAVELPGRGLVLDIRDGEAPPGNPFELLRPTGPDAAAVATDTTSPRPRDAAAPLAPASGAVRLRFDPSLGRPPDSLAGWLPGRPASAVVGDATPTAGRDEGLQPGTEDAVAEAEAEAEEEAGTDRPAPPAAPEAVNGTARGDPALPLIGAPVETPVETPVDTPVGFADGFAEGTAAPRREPAARVTADAAPQPDFGLDEGRDARPRTGDERAQTDVAEGPAGTEVPQPGSAVAPNAATVPRRDSVPASGITQDASAAEVPVSALLPPPPRPDRAALALADRTDDPDLRPGRWVTAPPRENADALAAVLSVVPPDAASRPPVAPVTTSAAAAGRDEAIRPPDDLRRPAPDALLRLLPLRLPEAAAAPDPRAQEIAESFGAVLAEQIGRGLTQGVVDADRRALQVRVDRLAGGPRGVPADRPEASMTEPAPAPARPADPSDQIRIITAVDRLVAESGLRDGVAQGTLACLPDTEIDVAQWLPSGETHPDFGASRAALVGEFDRVSDAALERAVRYQIAYGFGAEARQLLESFLPASGMSEDRARVLRALSHIVDGESGPETAVLADQLACPSRAAIWGALARPNLPPDADYSREAVLRAFEDLPTGLRRSLGPGLATRFFAVGDMDTVATLRRSIARIDLPDDAASEIAREAGTLLDARIEAAAGNSAAAEARLAEVARIDGQLAREAVADLIEAHLARGEPPDDALVTSASALAFEFRGTDDGARLRRGELLALVLREDFDAALQGLRRAVDRDELPADAAAEVATRYLQTLTERATDRAFLSRAPAEFPGLLALGVGPEVRIAAADRMTGLGLPEAALPMVDGLRSDPDARMASARAWLRLNDPAAALARTAGLDGEAAARLRAEAYAALGDPAAAADALDRIGATDAASAAAWRAGDVARVAENPQAARAALAELAIEAPLQAPGTDATLSEHRQLIDGAARLRETIAAELAGPSP